MLVVVSTGVSKPAYKPGDSIWLAAGASTTIEAQGDLPFEVLRFDFLTKPVKALEN